MRSITQELQLHLESEVTSLATCWKLTRQDGTVLGFTDHSEGLLFETLNYEASTGFTASSIESKSDFSVDNLDVEGMIDSSSIKESDLMGGLYDFAEIEIFIVNYADLSQGRMLIRKGWLGEVQINKSKFIAEVRGLTQKLNQNMMRIYAPSCDCLLGDARCGVEASTFTSPATVSAATSRQIFKSPDLTQEAGYFIGGEIHWQTGLNAGLRMEIKEFENFQITLALPMPNTIHVDDTFNAIAGCDKTFETCKSKFTNSTNFRGFPHIPGMDQILQTSGTLNRG
nr:hypothetical protein 3 [bacterium]